jgi:S1-C subfamily serine protease
LETDEPVPRGTLQVIWRHKPFDEVRATWFTCPPACPLLMSWCVRQVRRLGLTSEAEERVRAAFPNETGCLVVDQVLPKGPADGLLEPGDVMLEVNQQLLSTFLPVEETLDESVGQEVAIRVQRGGEVSQPASQ